MSDSAVYGVIQGDYIAVKALENGVTIIGLTRVRIPSSTILKNLTRVKL